MASEEHRELRPGRTVAGRYLVKEHLGQGGMGVLYVAEHIELGREVALKVLAPELLHDPRRVARFKKEARAAAAVRHRGIVEVFDLGDDDGLTFVVMELLPGDDLKERVTQAGQLDPSSAAQLGAELCAAVGAAHEAGIVHRDLKPENVFIVAASGDEPEMVKVLDFGLAKLLAPMSSGQSLSQSGEILGTPLYMSPEQLFDSKNVDTRTDVYAIGALLYFVLAGAPPYEGDSFAELVLKVGTESPPHLTSLRADLPQRLALVIERAMAKDKEDRYATVGELGEALRAAKADGSDVPPAAQGSDVPPAAQGSDVPPAAQGSDVPPAAQGSDVPPAAQGSDAPLPSERADRSPAKSEEPAEESPDQPSAKKGTSPLLLLGGAALILGLVAVGFWPEGARDQDRPAALLTDGGALSEQKAAKKTVRVFFHTRPAGAQVFVDGSKLCETPCETQLEPRPIQVKALAAGFLPSAKSFGTPLPEKILLHLEPEPEPEPEPEMEEQSDSARRSTGKARGTKTPQPPPVPPLEDRE